MGPGHVRTEGRMAGKATTQPPTVAASLVTGGSRASYAGVGELPERGDTCDLLEDHKALEAITADRLKRALWSVEKVVTKGAVCRP